MIWDCSVAPTYFCYPLVVTLISTSKPWILLICSLHSSFILFQVLYKWHRPVWKLLRLASFTSSNIPEIHPLCCVYQWFASFYCWEVFHGVELCGVSFPCSCLLTSSPYCLIPEGSPFARLAWKLGFIYPVLLYTDRHGAQILVQTQRGIYCRGVITGPLIKEEVSSPSVFGICHPSLSLLPPTRPWNCLEIGTGKSKGR